MIESLREIASLLINATTEPTNTDIPGVVVIKGEVPSDQLAAVYEPMIGFVIQGSKTISIGSRNISMKAPSYFVIPVDVPATGQVQQSATGEPYLSVGLCLNQNSLADLFNDLPDAFLKSRELGEFSGCAASEEFIDAWLRMLRLLNNPEDIPALAPVYEREILYRVLVGPLGSRLQLCLPDNNTAKIRQVIQWIRQHYSEKFEIPQTAETSGISARTFYRRFKQITGLTPIQYQKQLRLLQARKLLILPRLFP